MVTSSGLTPISSEARTKQHTLRNSQGLVEKQGITENLSGSVYFDGGPETFERKKLAACHTALYSTDPSIDRENIIRAKGIRTPGTCEWIWSDPRFRSWLRGDRNLLWIRGGPGEGKTMMSVYLTEAITSEECTLAYYFCVGQDAERNNASAVLRGLLWQITRDHPNLTQYLLPFFDPPARGQATVSSKETLWNLLKDVCHDADAERLYCLVDGVDECDEESMHWLVDKFKSVGRENSISRLSLLVLSRPVTGLDDLTCITLDPDHHGQVSADVAKFVESKVDELSHKLGLDTAFQRNAASVLLEKSEGTFLWVGFVMSELMKKKTRSQVEKAMYSLPKGLPAVYARILHSIEPDDRENGKIILTCIAMAFKPLSLKSLAEILGCRSSATISVEQATLDEITVCAPMLHIREQRVDFVHQSAKDYLLRCQTDPDPVLEEFRIQPAMAHLYLARRCVQSLVQGSWLQHYSLLNWPNHAKHSENFASSLFEDEPLFFGRSSLSRDLWWRKYSLQFVALPQVVPPRLHIACFVGLESWVQAILLEDQRSGRSPEDLLSEKCPSGWSAFNYAAESASEEDVKLLLQKVQPTWQLERTTRHAAMSKSERVVQLLLHHGADADTIDVEDKSDTVSSVGSIDSVSSISSISSASSVSSADSSDLYGPLLLMFTIDLVQSYELASIFIAALDEPKIGTERFETNIRRLIARFGLAARSEGVTGKEIRATRLLRSKHGSVRAAQYVYETTKAYHRDTTDDTTIRSTRSQKTTYEAFPRVSKTAVGEEESDRGESDREESDRKERDGDDEADQDKDDVEDDSEEDELTPGLSRQDFEQIKSFLFQSTAFGNFKMELLDLVHRPYEQRIFAALRDSVLIQKGKQLPPESHEGLVQELTWVPPSHFTFTSDIRVPILDHMKSLLEDTLDEVWNWWPLGERVHALDPGFCRLHWVTPGGTVKQLDIPQRSSEALKNALLTAPRFLDASDTEIQVLAGIKHSPAGIAPAGSSSGAPSIQTPAAPPQAQRQSGQGQRAARPPAAGVGNVRAQPGAPRLRSRSPPRLTPGHIYLCVRAGGRNDHQFEAIRSDRLRYDPEFFAQLQAHYLRIRGWARNIFSWWRYDHCQFYRFHKYGIQRSEPSDVDLPADTDPMYNCIPTPPGRRPPKGPGPVSPGEFRDRFQNCYACHSWHRHRHNVLFSTNDDSVLKALPKRIEELEMQDGKREDFWGIYAKERRCFGWVAAYAIMANAPGVIFFFLWLFQWGHESDLQGASVPVMISLSLSLTLISAVLADRD